MTTCKPDSCPAASSKLLVAHRWSPACSGLLRLLLWVMLSATGLQAQWLTQSFTLKPGWNAIYTHVDASYTSLDNLVPDANGPVAEVWLWKPTFSTIQFISSPLTNLASDSRWAVWTSARGDTDTLTALVGNGAYLVNNRTTTNYVWTVKGKPVPPSYQWTTTGLNLLGFPTPTNVAPDFATYLTPAPGLDLSKSLQNSAHVFGYQGGTLGTTNPVEVISLNASTTPVTRGQAVWIQGSTNYYNRYYGPVEVVLQNPAGMQFSNTLGTYSIRLRNLTTVNRTVTFSMVASDTPPTGQPAITDVPQLLVRGALSPTSLTYAYTALPGQQFTLMPQGQVGSELQVVLGLNRTAMTAASGSLYAGILRITDTAGLQQTDVPVSATVPDASGLWVGQASINQVGQYLKSYPKVDTTQANQTTLINAAAAQAGLPAGGAELPGSQWIPRETNYSRAYSAVAMSLDGRVAVVAVTSGMLYTSQDFGATWTSRDASRNWAEVTCSADGSVMYASVYNGPIYVSSNYGTNWTATGSSSAAWVGLACSANGTRLAAASQNGPIYTSSNGGATWATSSSGIANWSCVEITPNGSNLVATANPGLIYVSQDAGNTWTSRAFNTNWSAIAQSDDGEKMIAAVEPGLLYMSADAGVTWRAAVNNVAAWGSVASSTDGQRLSAVVGGGQIYTSTDAGLTWLARDQNRNWNDIVSSGDGTRLLAVEGGGAIYTLNRTNASYTVDSATGLVTDQGGRHLASGTNISLAKVANPFPLRLILHNQTAASQISLLQHVYVGPGANTNITVVATRESLLDSTQLAAARRISATHLPFSRANNFWTNSGTFNPGNVVVFTVVESYKDQTGNPFLHTFHPDHDNLDANFKTVLPRGVESYDITRTIKLTFAPAGTDFASLTAAAQSRSGTYEETMTIGAQGSASRDFRLSGSFSLQLISPVGTLTTQ